MSASLSWTPLSYGETTPLNTWRPSSFIQHLVNHFGDRQALVTEDHIDWLREIEVVMGVDGGGHSEAAQLIAAVKKYGRILVEVDP